MSQNYFLMIKQIPVSVFPLLLRQLEINFWVLARRWEMLSYFKLEYKDINYWGLHSNANLDM